MRVPFEQWKQKISEAVDERSRRELLAEIGQWRAQKLGDVSAMRSGAYALSRLYGSLGNHQAALREARSLLTLCQTPPASLRAEWNAAKAHFSRLEAKIQMARGEGAPWSARAQEAIQTAAVGKFDQAAKMLRGGRGRRVGMLRLWVQLKQVLSATDPKVREALLTALIQDLEKRFSIAPKKEKESQSKVKTESSDGANNEDAWEEEEDIEPLDIDLDSDAVDSLLEPHTDVGLIMPPEEEVDLASDSIFEESPNIGEEVSPPADAAPQAKEKAETVNSDNAETVNSDNAETSELGKLLGKKVPRRRERRIALIEAHVQAHPDQVGKIAIAALHDHVDTVGAFKPAPWLISVVAQAWLGDETREEIKSTVDAMLEKNVYAVTAYEELPFQKGMAFMSEASGAGWGLVKFRRGVNAKLEPRGRRLWLLGLEDASGKEAMVILSESTETPYEPEVLDSLVNLLAGYSPRIGVWTPGPGNEGLRNGLKELGAAILDEEMATEAILLALSNAQMNPPKSEEASESA